MLELYHWIAIPLLTAIASVIIHLISFKFSLSSDSNTLEKTHLIRHGVQGLLLGLFACILFTLMV